MILPKDPGAVDCIAVRNQEKRIEKLKSDPVLPRSIPVLEAPPVDSLLALQLDPGEASVIQLALKRSVPNVLIDERKGRKIARRVYGLHTIGTARVLVEARQAGLIAEIAPLFDRLREESYWIADPIVKWAKSAAGET